MRQGLGGEGVEKGGLGFSRSKRESISRCGESCECFLNNDSLRTTSIEKYATV